ncbi:MAG: hypothetical protein HYT48_03390 [Candidatus Vogelbacteria bacterium]|nr:hypothetical protein [Candidatus Vogelbacteria bacterium]
MEREHPIWSLLVILLILAKSFFRFFMYLGGMAMFVTLLPIPRLGTGLWLRLEWPQGVALFIGTVLLGFTFLTLSRIGWDKENEPEPEEDRRLIG